MDENRKAEAHYFLGIIYKEPVFVEFVKTDIKKSYEMMVTAANLGFDPAKEELSHYKKTLFGKYVYI